MGGHKDKKSDSWPIPQPFIKYEKTYGKKIKVWSIEKLAKTIIDKRRSDL